MGLDDFMDLDTSEEQEESASNSQDEQNHSQLLKFDNWVLDENGEPSSRGLFGYKDDNTYKETIVGELQRHGDLFKYNLPIFPHIELEDKYERGKRYRLENNKEVHSCISHIAVPLCKINREMVMLDTGELQKEKCVEVLSDRFSEDVGPSTEVHLYFFAMMRHVVKMAASDTFVDDWSLEDRDRVLKAVYREAYTQDFREKDTGERDLRHMDEIPEW